MPDLPRSQPDALFEALGARRLLVVSGKGGVGRTTVSALLGAELAARGRRVLIATTGHDDRLAWMLGHDALQDTPVEVAPGLEIQRLNPSVCVEEYGAMITRSARLSQAVFGNRAVSRLMRAIPGLDDFAILGKAWHEACRAKSYDTLIFDGPASGHLRLILGVPKALVETIAEGPLSREATLMFDALRDGERTALVLVALPEAWPLTEMGELAGTLQSELGMHVGAMVINKLWPGGLPTRVGARPTPAEPAPAEHELDAMFGVIERVAAAGDEQRQTVLEWLQTHPQIRAESLLTVPWWPQGLDGRDQLDRLLAAVREGGA